MKLRQVAVLTSQGATVADAIRQIGVTQLTYYRWHKEFGGLQTNQVKRITVGDGVRHRVTFRVRCRHGSDRCFVFLN